jgi:hypothetical protein
MVAGVAGEGAFVSTTHPSTHTRSFSPFSLVSTPIRLNPFPITVLSTPPLLSSLPSQPIDSSTPSFTRPRPSTTSCASFPLRAALPIPAPLLDTTSSSSVIPPLQSIPSAHFLRSPPLNSSALSPITLTSLTTPTIRILSAPIAPAPLLSSAISSHLLTSSSKQSPSPGSILDALPSLIPASDYPGIGARPYHRLDYDGWSRLTAGVLSSIERAWILDGIRNGIDLGYTGKHEPRFSPNLPTIALNPESIDQDLLDGYQDGGLAGPFDSPPTKCFRNAPLGLVTKSDGTWRVIEHLSWPRNHSVNDYVIGWEVTYDRFDVVLDWIAALGPGAIMSKFDLRAAFRQIPVVAHCWELLGLYWRDRFWHRTCLPFGLRSSPALFCRFTRAMCAIVRHMAWACCSSAILADYLDDFLAAGRANTDDCHRVCETLQAVCAELNLVFKHSKTEWCVTRMKYRGLIVDTLTQEVSLDPERVLRITGLLRTFLNHTSCDLHRVQVLAGHLAFAGQAIQPGRMMTQRIYQLLSLFYSTKQQYLRITAGARRDAGWWLHFLQSWNGRTIIPRVAWNSDDVLHIYTDASTLAGGCWFPSPPIITGLVPSRSVPGHHAPFAPPGPGQWISEPWSTTEQDWSIPEKEAAAVAWAISTWSHLLFGRRVLIHCDAQGTVIAYHNTACSSPIIMDFVRTVWFICASNHIQLRIQHLLGVDNDIADALSRLRVIIITSLFSF